MKQTGIVVIAVIAIVIIAAAAYLVTQPAAPVTPTPTPKPTPTPTATPTPTPTPTTPQKVKVAILFAGVWNDMGWHTGMYQRAHELKDELNIDLVIDDGLRYTVGEYTADPAVAQRAAEGYNIILGHGFGFKDPMLRTAPKFPNTWFIHTAGFGMARNVGCYMTNQWDGAYLAGIVAGSITKTNKIGAIAGFELVTTNALMEMFWAGAYRVNPNVQFIRTYPGTWDDATKGREAAIAQMDAGADVIMGRGGEMELGVIQAVASRKGVWMIGDMIDQHALASDVVITSNIVDWGVPLSEIVKMYRNKTLENKFYKWGLKEGAAGIAPFYKHENVVPKATRDLLVKVEADVKAGRFVIPLIETRRTTPWVPAGGY